MIDSSKCPAPLKLGHITPFFKKKKALKIRKKRIDL